MWDDELVNNITSKIITKLEQTNNIPSKAIMKSSMNLLHQMLFYNHYAPTFLYQYFYYISRTKQAIFNLKLLV